MVNSPFDDNCDDNDEEHNQIELVMPALNMIQKFTTMFIHCYITSSNYVFATKKRFVFIINFALFLCLYSINFQNSTI